MAVQFEEFYLVIFTDEHYLAAVGFVAGGLAVRAAPVEVPLFAEVVLAVYLMVLQTVDVCHVVAAYQMVVFVVYTFAPHISVDGIAGVEEGISDVVGSAETVAEITQRGNL